MCSYSSTLLSPICLLFFFNDTATTEIYTLSLHDALPIPSSLLGLAFIRLGHVPEGLKLLEEAVRLSREDRKSTRLNSSHTVISYAVFCLKKKKENETKGRSERKERKRLSR